MFFFDSKGKYEAKLKVTCLQYKWYGCGVAFLLKGELGNASLLLPHYASHGKSMAPHKDNWILSSLLH